MSGDRFSVAMRDYAFWRLVRMRMAGGWPLAAIAADLGWEVNDLTAWVLAYREPRYTRFANRGFSPEALSLRRADPHDADLTAYERRLAAWKFATDGATRRLDEIAEQAAQLGGST